MSRVVSVVAVILGIVLLAAGLLSGVLTSRDRATAELDAALTATVGEQTAVIEKRLGRARSIALLTAANPDLTGDPAGEGVARVLRDLEVLFPGAVIQTRLIDDDGRVVAQTVRGVPTLQPQIVGISVDPSAVAEYLALKPGSVREGAAFLSQEVGDWVVPTTTVVPATATAPARILQIAIPLTGLQIEAPPWPTTLVDARTGYVLLDSTELALPRSTATPRSTSEAVELVRGPANSGRGWLGDRRIAFERVSPPLDSRDDETGNVWYVVIAGQSKGGWTGNLGGGSLALVMASVLLLGGAAASLRGYQKALRAAALHDGLTDLPKRELLLDRANQALRTAHRTGGMLAVLLLDLDRFKDVNDTLGHHHGDLLLRQVSMRMATTLRDSDTLARLGGDEFAVLLPEVLGLEDAQLVADRMLETLYDSFQIDDVTLDVEASIGIALAPDHGNDAELLLRRADVAMYQAKELQIGSAVYNSAQDVHTPTRLLLLGDLRRALESHGQLELYYQPKLDPVHENLHGVEALLRWQHPERGLVMPMDFLPLVEGTALIGPLTIRVLEIALAQAKVWMVAGRHIPVAVNLSTRCLVDRNFPDAVLQLLGSSGVPASLLCLEITESAIMSNPETAMSVLDQLHAAGIRLSIDDFGTGYSSMAYLKRLPVDELKVDRSFVKEMIRETNDAILVRSAVDLGHNLGLSVVAEGVEDSETLTALRNVNCDFVQGYHLGRPMPVERFEEWLVSLDARVAKV